MSRNKILEWSGVATAIVYSLIVAMNIDLEFIGFALLFISAILIGLWAYFGKHKGILFLQLFYATAGIIGMVRWY
tara:strand:+ start:183 stop:407 length:225 start_codon:yes stop_codon:yes gene_type:complete